LTAQTTYQQSVIGLVQAQANRLSDTVALYQALGGGWWNRDDLAEPKKPGDHSYFGTLTANIPWVVRAATATPSASASTNVASAAPTTMSSTTDVAAAPAVDTATTQTGEAAPN
jgi:hypothetical protein